MSISIEEVKKVGLLARLGLTDKEVEKFSKEIAVILDYVKQLQEVDTTGVEPTFQVTQLKNSQREDQMEYFPEEDRKKLIINAPQNDGEYVRVKRVK